MAILTGAISATVVAASIFTWRGEIIKFWHLIHLRSEGASVRWALAKELEESDSGRGAAEDWYLGLLRDAPVAGPGESVLRDSAQGSFIPYYFYSQGEQDLVKATARLVSMKSYRAIPVLARRLQESDPESVIVSEHHFVSLAGHSKLDSPPVHFTVLALLKIGGPAIDAFAASWKHASAHARLQILLGLYWLGGECKETESIFLEALQDTDEVIELALWILFEFTCDGGTWKGPPETYHELMLQMKPLLILLLSNPSGQIRSLAAYAIKRLGKDALDVIPALEIALQDPHEPMRVAAKEALGAIQSRKK